MENPTEPSAAAPGTRPASDPAAAGDLAAASGDETSGKPAELDMGLTGLEGLDLSVAGRTALLQDRMDDAIQILEKAVALRPDDFQSQNWLGIAYSRTGEYDRAVECLRQALRLSPANERYWYNLGTAHQASGQPLHAARYFQVALRLAPEYDRARQALTTLQVMNPQLQLESEQEPFAARSPAQLLNQLEFELAYLEELPTALPFAVSELVIPATRGEGGAADAVLSIDFAISDQPTRRFPGMATRVVAALIDIALVSVLWILVVMLYNGLQGAIAALPATNGIPIVVGAAVSFAYVLLMTSRAGQTVGKQVMRIQVVDKHGKPPTARRAIFRTAMMLLNVATAGLGYLWITVDRRRQGLHDKLSATYVIGRKVDPAGAVLWIVVLVAIDLVLVNFLRIQLM